MNVGILYIIALVAIIALSIVVLSGKTFEGTLVGIIISGSIVIISALLAGIVLVFAKPTGESIRYEVTTNEHGAVVYVTENGAKNVSNTQMFYDIEADVPYVSFDTRELWCFYVTDRIFHVPGKVADGSNED